MTYTAPVRADLIARFPEFTDTTESLVSAILTEAGAEVGEAWGDWRSTATMYLAAHLLATEGATDAERANSALGRGDVSSVKVGGEQTTWAARASSETASAGDYTSTPYGRRYAEIRKRAFAGTAFAV